MTPRARQRLLTVLIVVSGVSLALGLTLWGLSGKVTFFYTSHELVSLPPESLKNIRLGGLVETGSLQQTGKTHIFTLTDNIAKTKVQYDGLLPDLFREGQGIVAYGSYNPDTSVFTAIQVLAKHDENYMPPELAKALKDEHNTGIQRQNMVE